VLRRPMRTGLMKCKGGMTPKGGNRFRENIMPKQPSKRIQSDAAASRRCPSPAPTIRAAASRAEKVFDRTKIR
jgi:hypothetical protein